MKVANIYPIKNQEFYRKETMSMILAHLVKKGYYNPENFYGSYVIMDNGLFEGEQVSTSLLDCINIAEASGINVSEIIIPDVVNDLEATKQLFLDNYDIIDAYEDKYTFMFVAQSKNYKELQEAISFINQYKELPLVVGISKLCPFDRGSKEAIKCYVNCQLPIHFLGIKKSFKELLPVSKLIRSCDSSQIATIAKHELMTSNFDVLSYTREEKTKEPIDLEKDNVSKYMLAKLLLKQDEEFRKYELL